MTRVHVLEVVRLDQKFVKINRVMNDKRPFSNATKANVVVFNEI